MRIPADAWGDVGDALYDLPDTELAALAGKLRTLARAEPGRAGDVLLAFAAMIEVEQQWRADQVKSPPQPPKRHLTSVG